MGENAVISFDSAEVGASFRVDPQKRTISGLVIPWGAIADNGFAKWRFVRDSVHYDKGLISRIKLNLNHDRHMPVGVARRLQSTPEGLDATFEIAEVPEGDKVLQLAKNNVLDGFSIEVDFCDGDEWVPDPADKSVRLVRSATLSGVALTAFPAFDDARVEKVVAHRKAPNVNLNKEKKVADEKEHEEEEEQEPANEFERKRAIEFTREIIKGNTDALVKAMEDNRNAMTSAFTAALEKLEMPQYQRGSVRAARFALDKDGPVYTFNGRGNSLVRDAWYARYGDDAEAKTRIQKYREQTEQVALYAQSQMFATVTTGDNGQIIPPGYRPDLYVGELMRGRPIVNMLSRGTIENASPFTVPVFVSSASATADHVEGINPADGTITFGTKTVSPEAISGRLVLTREMVDSSNPAIDQIALATMRESYARQTEAKAYAMLNGSAGVGGSITSLFVPSGAQADVTSGDGNDLLVGIRKAMARYPFNRFAFPTGALMSQEATTELATAQSAEDGRFQLPSINPSNSIGTGSPQGWNIDNVPFVPAWAMTGNTAGDADVIMLNREDAWVWESPTLLFRYEERSGPALIELALFGYFGTHVLRPVGLSGLRHTAG